MFYIQSYLRDTKKFSYSPLYSVSKTIYYCLNWYLLLSFKNCLKKPHPAPKHKPKHPKHECQTGNLCIYQVQPKLPLSSFFKKHLAGNYYHGSKHMQNTSSFSLMFYHTGVLYLPHQQNPSTVSVSETKPVIPPE